MCFCSIVSDNICYVKSTLNTHSKTKGKAKKNGYTYQNRSILYRCKERGEYPNLVTKRDMGGGGRGEGVHANSDIISQKILCVYLYFSLVFGERGNN